MLSKEQIDRLDELAAKATQGALSIDDLHFVFLGDCQLNDGYLYAQTHGPDGCENAEFIAAANPQTIQEFIAMLRESQKNDARYQWLKSRKGLSLYTDYSTWTREDGTKFINTHYLAEGNTRHASGESLDEIIDNAMKIHP